MREIQESMTQEAVILSAIAGVDVMQGFACNSREVIDVRGICGGAVLHVEAWEKA